ncbi:MAG: A/G-specific adenine glycosylase [Spirochaetales bacterium]|nr:A/G-specific adenine glycosylase [Spirochaetales bacterium]
MYSERIIEEFRSIVYSFYATHKRDLPWRNANDPYQIIVSEFMLQQTQVERVIEKYLHFLNKFPSFEKLAESSLRDILEIWQGLGYNRRAGYLRETAEKIVADFSGKLPANYDSLLALPGVGRYTASALLAFAFHKPVTVIDTNIRCVYIYSFFRESMNIPDSRIENMVERTIDVDDPREWYYALMDYGAFLGRAERGINHRSSHYRKQSGFKGSDREIRGMIIKLLLDHQHLSTAEMEKKRVLMVSE